MEEDCSHCSLIPGVAPEPVPRPVPDVTLKRYKKYEETAGYDRPIDDYMPRKQCKVQFSLGNDIFYIVFLTKIES